MKIDIPKMDFDIPSIPDPHFEPKINYKALEEIGRSRDEYMTTLRDVFSILTIGKKRTKMKIWFIIISLLCGIQTYAQIDYDDFCMADTVAADSWVLPRTAEILSKRIEYDAMNDGKKGMNIHVDMIVRGMKGRRGTAILFLEDENKNKIKNSKGNNKGTKKYFTPKHDNSHYSDFILFVPYSIHNGSNYYLKFVVKDEASGKFLKEKAYLHVTKAPSVKTVGGKGISSSNKSKSSGKTWKEELGNGLFAINHEVNGFRMRTIYRTCFVCRGTQTCSNCKGLNICTICQGKGGIVTPGYGRYIPCSICGQTGRCNVCKGTGKCVCTKYDYPGYSVGSTIIMDPNGRVISDSRDYDDKPSSSSTSSSSSFSTLSSSKGSCSVCGGTGIDPFGVEGNPNLTSWIGYYHSGGSRCPYCTKLYEHTHSKCAHCNVPKY